MTLLSTLSLLALLSAATTQASQSHEALSASGIDPITLLAAQDTAFKAVGNYQLDLAVGGQAMSMTFTVEKKADGSLAGVFRNEALGEIPTTKFRVEGRKMFIEVLTEGGPANVTLSVTKENVVEGEWTMEGDGSKISGKKAG